MTAQFTKGPWSVCKCFDHTGEHFKSFDIVPRDGHSLSGVAVLASVFGSEAEARLIAAAPKMYETLEWIRKIADANLEQDEKLRSQGARTLMRIADKAEEMMAEARGDA